MQNFIKIPAKTQWGTFLLEVTDRGLYAVRFPGKYRAPRPGLQFRRPGLDGVALRFRKYFKHSEVSFANVPLDLAGRTPFQRKVYEALRKVPAGSVVTYGELAKRAGTPGAVRAVGSVMKKNRLPIVIPCHRVIRSDGSIGEYSAGKKWKGWLLRHEGISLGCGMAARGHTFDDSQGHPLKTGSSVSKTRS